MKRLIFLGIALFLLPTLSSSGWAKQPIIVIDPGHGGTNQGAKGPTGRFEKEITLLLAKLCAKSLMIERPGLIVRLTREKDSYLTLRQRVERANQWNADLFLSIHLNASESRAETGYETYVLSLKASDEEAARLAQKENQSPAHEKYIAPKDSVSSILGDLKQRANHTLSLRFAKTIQAQLKKARVKAKNRGVRQAPFDVLMGLKMPGALVEVGYIDHLIEGRKMLEPQNQLKIASALSKAILSYLDSLEKKKKKKRIRRKK